MSYVHYRIFREHMTLFALKFLHPKEEMFFKANVALHTTGACSMINEFRFELQCNTSEPH